MLTIEKQKNYLASTQKQTSKEGQEMIEITCRTCHYPALVQSRKQKLCYLCRTRQRNYRMAKQGAERKSPFGYNRKSRRKAGDARTCDSYPERVKREIQILIASGVKNGLECESETADEIIKNYCKNRVL